MAMAFRQLRWAYAFAFAVLSGGAVQAQSPADTVTEAEKLLFQTDHMGNIGGAAKLEYRYSRDGEEPVTDRIIVTIDGQRSVAADYLTGSRHVEFPNIEDAHGNPLLLYFLEDDLREMGRQTQGQPDYFRRVMRRAMARPDLKVEATEVTVAGRKVPAQRVSIEPFRADPNAPNRYPTLIGKSYEFVLASALPGQIVSLTSHVPLANGKMDTVRVEWAGSGSM
jgi:hypothetical protein